MSDYKITKEDIYAATEGGKAVILSIYPQSAAGFSGRRNFRIREGDDRKPSCTVFQKDGVWFLQDKGGTDTKAYTAVELVRKEYNLNYPQALEWIASKFAPDLLQGKDVRDASVPKPEMARMPGQDSMTVQLRPDGKFTKGELDLLGRGITQELCEQFDLKPVTSYVTARTAKGDSWKITATPEYPVYYYDYGDYGKIYCPLGGRRRKGPGTAGTQAPVHPLQRGEGFYGQVSSSCQQRMEPAAQRTVGGRRRRGAGRYDLGQAHHLQRAF